MRFEVICIFLISLMSLNVFGDGLEDLGDLAEEMSQEDDLEVTPIGSSDPKANTLPESEFFGFGLPGIAIVVLLIVVIGALGLIFIRPKSSNTTTTSQSTSTAAPTTVRDGYNVILNGEPLRDRQGNVINFPNQGEANSVRQRVEQEAQQRGEQVTVSIDRAA